MRSFNRPSSLLYLLVLGLFSPLRADELLDIPGRFAVDIARPIKRAVKQQETDAGTVIICDLFHQEGDILQWITYSDYPAGTLEGKDAAKVFSRWVKGDAATNHGTVSASAVQRLGETVGCDYVIEVAKEKKVIRSRIFIVGDRTYRIWYSGPVGTENSPTVLHFLDSFRLTP